MGIQASHFVSSPEARRIVTCVVVVSSVLLGCRPASGPARYDVRGTVTFKGEPVPSGSITLEPDPSGANSGPVSVIPIIDGTFDSRALKRPGPLAGPLMIRIKGYPAFDPALEGQPPLFPEYQTTANLKPSSAVTELVFEVPERR